MMVAEVVARQIFLERWNRWISAGDKEMWLPAALPVARVSVENLRRGNYIIIRVIQSR